MRLPLLRGGRIADEIIIFEVMSTPVSKWQRSEAILAIRAAGKMGNKPFRNEENPVSVRVRHIHHRRWLARGKRVCGGVVWAMRHPEAGIVDPEDMDFREVLEAARPYLGTMVGKYTDWTPVAGRGELFPEDLDAEDPWQFRNVRV